MTAMLRSASLTHFADLSAEYGVDAKELIREVDLPLRCLSEPDLLIPATQVGRLLELAAVRCREPAFGLRLAQSRRLSNLGPLGLLVRDEPTLRHALEALVGHIHVHNEALTVGLEQVGNLVVIRIDLAGVGGQILRQATELAVGVTFRVVGFFMGSNWRPRLVCFAHRAPESLSAHRRFFGEPVEFGHEFSGIVCNAADLDVPNPGADPVMAIYAKRLLESETGAAAGWADRVTRLVVLLLPRGLCRIDVVAQHLGVDRRTIARHLALEDTTFSALVDQIRRELMERYSEERGRSLSEVALLLGFSAPSAFSRWHRAQYGASARERMHGR